MQWPSVVCGVGWRAAWRWRAAAIHHPAAASTTSRNTTAVCTTAVSRAATERLAGAL